MGISGLALVLPVKLPLKVFATNVVSQVVNQSSNVMLYELIAIVSTMVTLKEQESH